MTARQFDVRSELEVQSMLSFRYPPSSEWDIEQDPHDRDIHWCALEGALHYRWNSWGWVRLAGSGVELEFPETPERVVIWTALLLNP